jgi:thioredoxin reductase (NADPH)
MSEYDLLIIGSGPAGLTAALFAARAGLKGIVFEENVLGGAIINTEKVENFPTYPNGISGVDLSTNLVSQVMQYGVEFKLCTVTKLNLLQDELKRVETTEGEFLAKAVIIAGGAKPKKLEIPGVDSIEGNGLSYCAYCDGNHFENKEVAIIGGGDGGVTDALYMTRIAAKVTLIEMLPKLNASVVLQQRALKNSKIEIFCSTAVEDITADGALRNLILKNVNTGQISNLKVSGIFVHIGLLPQTQNFKDIVGVDNLDYILVNHNMETNVPGIFAAGDIRAGSVKQWIVAAGDGAIAAISAEKYITLKLS